MSTSLNSSSVLEDLMKPKKRANLGRYIILVFSILSITFAFLHLYFSFFGGPSAYIYRTLHVSLVLSIIFLVHAYKNVGSSIFKFILYILLSIVPIVIQALYILADQKLAITRAGSLIPVDYWIGGAYILLVLIATGLSVGWVLVLLASFFIANALWANHFVSVFYGPPVSLEYIIETLFFREQGIFSIPIGAMVNYIVIFIIFGSILLKSGAGRLFTNIAISIAGSRSGGPAKAAVLASGMLGTVSGSAVANVVTTGNVTIPLMKQLKYRPTFAGGVEAVASSGAQIMPPIMGATAFIMAEFLSVPYSQVIIAAVIPALLYYISLWFMVDFEAKKNNFLPIPKEEVPSLKKSLIEGGHLLIPIFILIGLLISGLSVIKSGSIAILSLLIITSIKKDTRMSPIQFFDALINATKISLQVSLACATAGIIIGVAYLSGTALRLTDFILNIGQGNLLIALLVTAIASMILGMGLTTSADYILLAALAIPSLIELGLSPMQAHMFGFYFASLSGITPPVALAAFAAAGLAETGMMRTGLVAVKIGIAAFIVPFMFAYGPELLLTGSIINIIIVTGTAIIGLIALAAAVQGYLFYKLNVMWRLLLGASSILMIVPYNFVSFLGIGLFGSIFLIHKIKSKKLPNNQTSKSNEGKGFNSYLKQIEEKQDPLPNDVTIHGFGGRKIAWILLIIISGFFYFAGDASMHVKSLNGFLIGTCTIITLLTLMFINGKKSNVRNGEYYEL